VTDRPSDDVQDPLDEELQETFPASDPPSHTASTGAIIHPDSVVDRPDARRFELDVDGHVAFVQYERRPDAIAFVHTEVPRELRGRGVGDVLVKGALAAAKAEGLRVIPICPFVKKYLAKHPEP